MDNVVRISDLTDALEHYLEKKREHDSARNKYQGYSWGWYGESWRKAMEEAQHEYEDALKSYLDNWLIEKLKELKLVAEKEP
jgi:metal-responsive CopG/Arc/MetJ family transcriptional regulator